MQMILKDVSSAAIYSDSDVIFIKPIDELWAQLKNFEQRHAVAISPTTDHPLSGSKDNENFISHNSGLFQINSGVCSFSTCIFMLQEKTQCAIVLNLGKQANAKA